jgi:hypothetical protein
MNLCLHSTMHLASVMRNHTDNNFYFFCICFFFFVSGLVASAQVKMGGGESGFG